MMPKIFNSITSAAVHEGLTIVVNHCDKKFLPKKKVEGEISIRT